MEQAEYYGYSGIRVKGLIFAAELKKQMNYQRSLMSMVGVH